ncbi:MAG: beta-hexosaminidase [Lysobacteraceae bacterium]|nr:MAG: beta-hexosaminidase [Xanthomonadaceae bacterium]
MTSLIVGIGGTQLADHERTWLLDPGVSGVILFKRNSGPVAQLRQLCDAIRTVRDDLLICVDQEGGRVQRFVDGFSTLPALGQLAVADTGQAQERALWHGWLMAAETLAAGADLSFAPVLDLDRASRVIGDRAFSDDPEVVSILGAAYVAGMAEAGMQAVGKHFPGHGSVIPDTHHDVACDDRPMAELESLDLKPFSRLAQDLGGLMLAHVAYPAWCQEPAGFSSRWVDYIRQQLNYDGALISDDLGMAAAVEVGDIAARLRLCCEAAVDIALVCDPADVPAAIESGLGGRCTRMSQLRPTRQWSWSSLVNDPKYAQARRTLGITA